MKNILFLFLLLCLAACDKTYKVEKKEFEHRNKTDYTFPLNKVTLRNKLLELFSLQGQYENPIKFRFENHYLVGFDIESKEDMFFRKEILNIEENKDDIILGVHNNKLWSSEYYIVDGVSGRMRGEFHIHLTALSESSTKVEIIPIELKIISGSKCCNPHSGYTSVSTSADSSSIEEYILLHHIGSYLGIKMPDVLRPAR